MTPLRIPLAAALTLACTATAWAVSPPADETPGGNQGDRTQQGMRVDAEHMPAWNTMTAQERQQFLRDMQSAKTPDQCRQVMDKHQQLMTERARERGVPPPNQPQRDMCAGMSTAKPAP